MGVKSCGVGLWEFARIVKGCMGPPLELEGLRCYTALLSLGT